MTRMHGLDDVLAARAATDPGGYPPLRAATEVEAQAVRNAVNARLVPLAQDRALAQITAWKMRGLIVELRGRPEGFILEVRTDDTRIDLGRVPDRPRFSYTTAVLPTPEQCVAQALEDLQR